MKRDLHESQNGSSSDNNADSLPTFEGTAADSSPELSPLEQAIRQKEETIRRQTFESAFAWDTEGNLVLEKDGQQYEIAHLTQPIT